MRPRTASLLLCLCVIPSLPVGARAETADGIVGRLRAMVEPVHDRTMRLTMHLRNASGGEDVRSMRGFEKRTAEGWKLLYVYDSPVDLAGTSFLTWRRRSEPDLLWAYFPAQARVRQLPKPAQQTRFQGSDFSYEDLRLLAFDYEAQHRLEGEAACGDARCYVLETTLPAGAFPYETLRSWLRTDTLLPDRVEFRGQELMKVMRVLRAGRVDGIPTLLALEMETPKQGHRTAIDIDQVAYNTGIDESFFSTARLSRMDQ
jgi:Outer membrane lipoprotein-sorting protein